MLASDLGFFTTQELIQELCSRTTFVGTVIYSLDEDRVDTCHDSFVVSTSLSYNDTEKLLDFASDQVREAKQNSPDLEE